MIFGWQNKYYVRKRGTLDEWREEIVAFGMLGLYGRLGVPFNGAEAAKNEQLLKKGLEFYVGDYLVRLDYDYSSRCEFNY